MSDNIAAQRLEVNSLVTQTNPVMLLVILVSAGASLLVGLAGRIVSHALQAPTHLTDMGGGSKY